MEKAKCFISSTFCFIVLLTFLFLSSSLAFAGDIVYVDADATGSNDGSSWTDAYTDLQGALSVAAYGDEICVAEGTYKPGSDMFDSFSMINGVAIYGGFDPSVGDTDFSDRDWENNATILSGDIGIEGYAWDNCHIVIYNPASTALDSTAILDGFTITGGTANYPEDGIHGQGGGMFNDGGSSPTVINCTFTDNFAYVGGGGMCNREGSCPTVINCIFDDNYGTYSGFGAGMYNHGSSPMVTDCIFSNNYHEYPGVGMANRKGSNPTVVNCTFSSNWCDEAEGGGIYNQDSSPVITNCTFENNFSNGSGGGIYNQGPSPITISDCIFMNNASVAGGGGIANWNSSPTVTNCVFESNGAFYGGGIWVFGENLTVTNCTFFQNRAEYSGGGISGSNFTVINCTFYDNEALYEMGGGIDCSGPVTVINSILWNDSPDEIYPEDPSTAEVIYSDIEGGWTGTGNIDVPPLFVDPANGDFHLLWNSQCIDAGTNTDAPSNDIEGNPRPIDGDGNGIAVVDMGAYEFCYPGQAITGRLENARNIFNGLDNNVFDKKAHRDTLIKWLDQALHHFNNGHYSQALMVLEEKVIPRIDGCALRGSLDMSPPIKKDWIITCMAQGQVYPLLNEAIELLKSLM